MSFRTWQLLGDGEGLLALEVDVQFHGLLGVAGQVEPEHGAVDEAPPNGRLGAQREAAPAVRRTDVELARLRSDPVDRLTMTRWSLRSSNEYGATVARLRECPRSGA